MFSSFRKQNPRSTTCAMLDEFLNRISIIQVRFLFIFINFPFYWLKITSLKIWFVQLEMSPFEVLLKLKLVIKLFLCEPIKILILFLTNEMMNLPIVCRQFLLFISRTSFFFFHYDRHLFLFFRNFIELFDLRVNFWNLFKGLVHKWW